MTMAKARIAVIGAGLMGHGIAQVFALAGHEVSIHDSVVGVSASARVNIPSKTPQPSTFTSSASVGSIK